MQSVAFMSRDISIVVTLSDFLRLRADDSVRALDGLFRRPILASDADAEAASASLKGVPFRAYGGRGGGGR